MSYRCSNGHDIAAPEGVRIKRCPHFVQGKPCQGSLTIEGSVKQCDGSGSHVGVDPRSRKGKGRCPDCGKLYALTKDSKLRTHPDPNSGPEVIVPEPDDETVTVTLPGAAWHIIHDGGWPNDNPRGWAAIEAGEWRKRGFGNQITFTLLRDDAEELADYLWSVEGVVAGMSTEERDGSKDHVVAGKAVRVIEDALG